MLNMQTIIALPASTSGRSEVLVHKAAHSLTRQCWAVYLQPKDNHAPYLQNPKLQTPFEGHRAASRCSPEAGRCSRGPKATFMPGKASLLSCSYVSSGTVAVTSTKRVLSGAACRMAANCSENSAFSPAQKAVSRLEQVQRRALLSLIVWCGTSGQPTGKVSRVGII